MNAGLFGRLMHWMVTVLTRVSTEVRYLTTTCFAEGCSARITVPVRTVSEIWTDIDRNCEFSVLPDFICILLPPLRTIALLYRQLYVLIKTT